MASCRGLCIENITVLLPWHIRGASRKNLEKLAWKTPKPHRFRTLQLHQVTKFYFAREMLSIMTAFLVFEVFYGTFVAQHLSKNIEISVQKGSRAIIRLPLSPRNGENVKISFNEFRPKKFSNRVKSIVLTSYRLFCFCPPTHKIYKNAQKVCGTFVAHHAWSCYLICHKKLRQ